MFHAQILCILVKVKENVKRFSKDLTNLLYGTSYI